MSLNYKLKDEYCLAVQDQKDLEQISAQMTLFYSHDEKGINGIYEMAAALEMVGYQPEVTQGAVEVRGIGKCFELKTGPIPLRLSDDIKDVLHVSDLYKDDTGFVGCNRTTSQPEKRQPTQMEVQLKAALERARSPKPGMV